MSQRRKSQKRQKGNNLTSENQELEDNISSIPGLDEKKFQRIVHAAVEQRFSGPIPHPDILAHYNNIVPGAAERIIQMAESEKEHRHHIEKSALQADISEARLGQIFAFLIGITAIIAGAYTAVAGEPLAGGFIGGGGVIGLVSVFIWGRAKKE